MIRLRQRLRLIATMILKNRLFWPVAVLIALLAIDVWHNGWGFLSIQVNHGHVVRFQVLQLGSGGSDRHKLRRPLGDIARSAQHQSVGSKCAGRISHTLASNGS